MPLDTAYSVCPHDRPSACALAVERLDRAKIGRVRGAEAQSYTQGVVCAKVARYAERVLRRGAPPIRVGLEADVLTAIPLAEDVWPGADRVARQRVRLVLQSDRYCFGR